MATVVGTAPAGFLGVAAQDDSGQDAISSRKRIQNTQCTAAAGPVPPRAR